MGVDKDITKQLFQNSNIYCSYTLDVRYMIIDTEEIKPKEYYSLNFGQSNFWDLDNDRKAII